MRFIKKGVTYRIPNGAIVKVCGTHYMIPCFTGTSVALYLCKRHHITNIDNIITINSIYEYMTKKIDSMKIADRFYRL
jgi:hypothetical protein